MTFFRLPFTRQTIDQQSCTIQTWHLTLPATINATKELAGSHKLEHERWTMNTIAVQTRKPANPIDSNHHCHSKPEESKRPRLQYSRVTQHGMTFWTYPSTPFSDGEDYDASPRIPTRLLNSAVRGRQDGGFVSILWILLCHMDRWVFPMCCWLRSVPGC